MAFEGFTADERSWLASQRLGRPGRHSGQRPRDLLRPRRRHHRYRWHANGTTKKFRNVEVGSRVEFVDIVDTTEGWHPIYLEIRGTAEALRDTDPPADGFSHEVIRIHPDWVRSFNLPTI